VPPRWSGVTFALSWFNAAADPSVILSAAKDLRAAMDQDLRALIAPFSFTRFMEGKLISGEHEYVMGSDFGHTL